MVKGYDQKTDEDGGRGEKEEEAAAGGERRRGWKGERKGGKKRGGSRKVWLRLRRDGTGLGVVGRRQVRVWRGGGRGRGSTGCFIMQKLSRQLGRSGSAPLHQHRVGGGGGGGGGGGIQLGGGGLEKASAPESRKYRQPFCDKLFFGWSAPPPPPRQTTRARTCTHTVEKFGHGLEKRGVAIFYACGTRGREFSLSTAEQTEGGRGNGEKKRG